MTWTKTKFTPPPIGEFVNTKIDDENGERNFQKMKFEKNLWWGEDGTYVYYVPTHWAYIEKNECVYEKRQNCYNW